MLGKRNANDAAAGEVSLASAVYCRLLDEWPACPSLHPRTIAALPCCLPPTCGIIRAMCPTSQALLSALSTSHLAPRCSTGILKRMAAR